MAKKITWEDKEHILPYGTRENQVWDLDLNEIKTVVNANADSLAGLEGGYQGVLLIADTPTNDGYYLAGESGTYTNAGGLVVDLTNTIVFINKVGANYTLTEIDVPVTLTQTIDPANTTEAPSNKAVSDYIDTLRGGEVASGESRDVSGGKVFDAIEIESNTRALEDADLLAKINALTSNNVGTLAIADVPVTDGIYIAKESGTYTNAGNLVVDLTNTLTYISISGNQTIFDLIEIPIASNGYSLVSSLANLESLITNATSGYWLILEDIDLGGATKVLPSNVTLVFRGGKFSNGTLTGNNTKIEANLIQIFNNDLIINGTWDVAKSFPQWFGALADGVTNDDNAIQKTLDSFDNVYFANGEYIIRGTLNYNENQKIIGENKHKSIIKVDNGLNKNVFFPNIDLGTEIAPTSNSIDNVTFENITIDSNILTSGDFTSTVMGIVAISVKNMTIENVIFKNPSADCIYISRNYGGLESTINPNNININKCDFIGNNFNRNGISVIAGDNINITDNYFYKMTKADMPGAVDLEPNKLTEFISNVNISNNNLDGCKGGISADLPVAGDLDYNNISNITISNNNFKNQFVIPYVLDGQSYIGIRHAKNVIISNNNLDNADIIGIKIYKSYGINCHSNTIYKPNLKGILIKDVFDSKFDNNKITLENDTFNTDKCSGVYISTFGFVIGTNYALKNSSLNNNTIINEVTVPISSRGLYIEGDAKNLDISGQIKGFDVGIYTGKKSDGYPSLLSVNCNVVDNVTPLASFETGFIPDNYEWHCGKGVSFGKGSFSASTLVSITGLRVFPTSIIRVTRIGSVGLGNSLTAECTVEGTLNIISSSSESGSFMWEIVSP